MDAKKIFIGTIIWSLGLFLPLLLQILLMVIAVHSGTYKAEYARMIQDLLSVPLILQIYFIAMAVVGTALVILGFVSKPSDD